MIKRTTTFFIFIFILICGYSYAQVNVGATPYTSLKAAFDAINTGVHTGAITITITGNTTETATASLDSSGNGTGSNYTSISIQPSGGATRTISGAITGHLISLNGADNVTIDGLNTGGNTLQIKNSGTGAASTIRFINDATNNTVTNCTITGSTTSFGVVYFATGSLNGNDGNTISNNTITTEGTNYPTACIYSLGTSSALDNSGNIVSGNNISDFFSASAISNGINLTTGSSGWTISNNKFFQTASRTYTTANTHNAITASVGTGYTVTGNTIGYATAGGTGTYTMAGTIATRFIGINLALATGTTSSVQGNTIAAISLNTSSGASTTNGIICGINITGTGSVNIGNVTPNTIGATTGVNSIVGTSTTSGGLVVGINSSTTGTVVIQNNTFGAMACSGITAAVAGSVACVNVSGVAASMTISGNTIGNATTDNIRGGTTALTTGSSLVTGIAMVSLPTVSNITNNTIRNLTSYGTGGTGRALGVFSTGTSGSVVVLNITGNTIFNLTSNAANTTVSNGQTGVQGIMHSYGTGGVISGNTIYNLSNTNTGTGGYTVSGIGIGNAANTKIANNIIYGISNASTSATVTAPGLGIGILVRSGTTSDTIVNNMITLGAGQTTNTSFLGIMLNHGSTPDPVSNIFYNTISISGTVTSGAQPSFAIARTDFTVTARTPACVIQNNILDNSRTGGTGKHYAIANNYGATTPTATGWTSDYNVLNSASASTVAWWTTDQTIATWRTTSSGDLYSITAVPITYTNSASGNLRLNMGLTATSLESGATPISTVTTDIDGFARPKPGAVNGGGLAPDYGAGESDMVFLDTRGPVISYTNLANTGSIANRSLSATITDVTGVNVTAGTKPRIYYKKSTDANAFGGNTSGDNGWKWTEASNASSPFSFTIDNSIILGGSVTNGDIIQYFVVAQDLVGTPNVGATPLIGFTATSVSAITSAPATPRSYTITAAPLSGTYTVGLTLFNRITGLNLYTEERTRKVVQYEPIETDNLSVQRNLKQQESLLPNAPNVKTKEVVKDEKYSVLMRNGEDYKGSLYHEITPQERAEFGLSGDLIGIYTTITAAIADLNSRGVSGNTTLSLTDATYPTETFPLTVSITNEAVPSASAVVTLKPASGVSPLISGSVNSGALLKITNNYFTIDGSNTNGGTTKDMTITNTSVTTPNVIHIGSTGSTYIDNVTVKNCTVINGVNTSSAIVVSDAATLGTAGYFSNITVQNNAVQKAYIGIFMIGNAAGTSFATITGNDITASGANAIRLCGIYVQQTNGTVVSQNNVANFDGTAAEDDKGIWLATGCINTTVERNNIYTLKYTGTGGFGCYGIMVSSGTTNSNNVVKNNQISDLSGDGSGTLSENPHGIYLSGIQTGVKIYNNSVYLTGNTLNQASAIATGICLNTGSTADIKNNIVVNNLGLLAATGYGTTALYLATGFSQLEACDYNDFYCNPTGSGVKTVVRVSTTDYTALSSWQTASGFDANSASLDPGFTSTTNLLPVLSNSACWGVNGTGLPIASVTNDVSGNSRSTNVVNGPTDMGCYEFTPSGSPAAVVQSITGNGAYSYSVGSRLIALILVTGYTSPFDISILHYSGVVPPGVTGQQIANSYDSVWVSSGSLAGATYEIRLYLNSNNIRNINTIANSVIAKSNDGGTSWTPSPGTTNGYAAGNPGYAYATGLSSFSLFAVTNTDSPLPVELASFTSAINARNVELKWSTSKEENNAGFDVERKLVSENTWSKVGNVSGAGNSNTVKNYSFEDRNIATGKYNYRLKQIDFNGNFKYFNLTGEVTVGVPVKFELSQNYPNPFNPSTKINYDLPFESKVQIKIYDMTGKEVAQIVNETKTAGYYTVQFNASALSSGVYFYTISANGGSQSFAKTMKMVLVK